jgi:hypothetical protein
VTIEHKGKVHEPFARDEDWRLNWDRWTPEQAELARTIITEGTYLLDEKPMPLARARNTRATLLGTFDSLQQPSGPKLAEMGRELIPGLQRWGTVPMLGGPPKVGKSTFVADYCAALVIRGYRFLGYFEPAELSEDERRRDVWLINAENPPGELHEALLATGLQMEYNEGDGMPYYFHPDNPGDSGWLIVDHLEDRGSAEVFDLTIEANRDAWSFLLMQCPCAEDHVTPPPLTVIADGVTAILGSDTTRYGKWFYEFKALLRGLDIENGLAVGHNGLGGKHLMNGTESMAGPDGLWTLFTKGSDNPRAMRYFQTEPRLRGPVIEPTRLVVSDGRLTLRKESKPSADDGGDEDAGDSTLSADDEVLDRLIRAGTAGLLTTEVTGRGRVGKLRREAMTRLEAAGQIVSKADGLGQRWSLADTA